MINLLKKLKQLNSFKLLAFIGWAYIISVLLTLIIIMFTNKNYSEFIFNYVILIMLIAIIYTFIFVISIICGVIEYFKKKEFTEVTNDMFFYIFSTGLIGSIIIHLIICALPFLYIILFS